MVNKGGVEGMNRLKNIWKLKYKNKVYAFRLALDNGLFDVYVDDFSDSAKSKLVSSKKIKSIPLIDKGDMLVTEQELNGLVVKELEDKALLKSIDDYISKTDLTNLRVDLEKKKEQLRRKFWSYLPKKYLDDFINFHIENFDRNDNIYTWFNEEQKDAIEGYMRFCSKRLFKELTGTTKLSIRKAGILANIKQDVDDWVYDGVRDTGYFGGGVCTLGHTLRYEHYAYSKELNERIIFGVKCMSDFFETDKQVISALTSLQDRLLDEIKVVAYIKYKGLDINYVNEKEFWEVLKGLKGSFEEVYQDGNIWVTILSKWVKNGLPFTDRLLKTYNIFKNRYERKKEDFVFERDVQVLEGTLAYRLYESVTKVGVKDEFTTSWSANDYNLFFRENARKLAKIEKWVTQSGITRDDLRKLLNYDVKYMEYDNRYIADLGGTVTKKLYGEDGYKLKVVMGLLYKKGNPSVDILSNFKVLKKLFKTSIDSVYDRGYQLWQVLSDIKKKDVMEIYKNKVSFRKYDLSSGVLPSSHVEGQKVVDNFDDIYGYLLCKAYIEKELPKDDFSLRICDSIITYEKISDKQARIINDTLKKLNKD